MSWFRRVFAAEGAAARWDGTVGTPRSSNRASSLHLIWEAPRGPWTAVEAVLEVVEPPSVRALHFWALQVSFAGTSGDGGGAHLGLQWFEPHPGGTAVNWGGYRPGGGELDGSASALPSAPRNVNTRDYAWEPGRAYRLRVEHAGPAPGGATAWRGSVTDLARDEVTVVRDLWAAGDHLRAPMVWSEVFADCDAPPTTVRWSALTVEDASGARTAVTRARVNYQRITDGGCATTTSVVGPAPGSFEQRTGTTRTTPQDTVLTSS